MREEPQQGPWADTMHGGPWTRHGHSIPSLTVLAEIRPRNVYRCGGVRMCRTCQADAEAARGVTTSAPELSPAEAAIVARFEAAEVPAEVVEAGDVVERVARALAADWVTRYPDDNEPWGHLTDEAQASFRRDARAAIAAMPR